MKRSLSQSNIPIKRDSRVGVRTTSLARLSNKGEPSSANKRRAGSMERLSRASSLSNIRKTSVTPNLASHRGTYNKKSLGITPTLSGCSKRSFASSLSTPMASGSRSKSPFKYERLVNDKKWVMEQYHKVQQFLHENTNCSPSKYTNMKPLTIRTFIDIFSVLFKEIDPGFSINMTNYKEVIMSTLKTYQYSGQFSNSLLKTANTMHAWPHVICIFSWLVDIVTTIRRANSYDFEEENNRKEVFLQYLLERYECYNREENEEEIDARFGEKLVKLFNIDEDENRILEREVDMLAQKKDEQTQQLKEQSEKNEIIQNRIAALQNEVESDRQRKIQEREEIICNLNLLKERKEKRIESKNTLRKNIETLKEEVKKQPCTKEEVDALLYEIKDMRNIIRLKKEKLRTQKRIKNDLDLKKDEARTKVQAEIYRLNTDLMNLCMVEPQLKVLRLKEDSDFESEEFQNHVKTLPAKIKVFEHKINNEIEAKKASVATLEAQTVSQTQRIKFMQEKQKELTQKKTIFGQELEAILVKLKDEAKKRDEERNVFLNEIRELDKGLLDVSQKREQVEAVTLLKQKKEAELEEIGVEVLKSFENLSNVMSYKVHKMNDIHTSVCNMLNSEYDKALELQEKIIEDLKHLDKISKSS